MAEALTQQPDAGGHYGRFGGMFVPETLMAPLQELATAYDEARKVFRPGGVPLEEGDLLVQPDLAATFQLIADEGPDALYSGVLAQAIVAAQSATRSTNPDGVGRMTLADLADYEVAIREPVEGTYRGYRARCPGVNASAARRGCA